MPFNGSGTFERLYNWVNDAANGIKILATRMDAETDGIAAGLSNCITRDGQGKPTAAQDWNGQNLTSVGALGVTGTATLAGNVTIGDTSGDSVTLNAGTVVAPNGANFEGNAKLSGASSRVFDFVYSGTTAGAALGSVRAYGTGSGVTGGASLVAELESGSITEAIWRVLTGATTEVARFRNPSGVPTFYLGKVAANTTEAGIWAYRPAGTGGSYGRINIIKETSDANSDTIAAYYGGAYIGGMTNTTTSTSFVISSDGRLKKNITAAPDPGPIIDALEIKSFDWRADGSHVRFGGIAQDMFPIYPEAIIQGDDGETIEKTWGVDWSKYMPLVLAELKLLRARVAALEATA